MKNFKSLYDVLLEALKGKRVRLRSYDCNDWKQFEYKGKPEDGKIVKWSEKEKYVEWTGTVKDILHNDNSHVDIIFDDKLSRTRPSDNHYWDCFNWHMGDYIEILN